MASGAPAAGSGTTSPVWFQLPNIQQTFQRWALGTSSSTAVPEESLEHVPIVIDVEAPPTAATAPQGAAAAVALPSTSAPTGQGRLTNVIRTLTQHGPAAAVAAAAAGGVVPPAVEGGPAPDETAAEAAERHRLATTSNVNAQAFVQWLELGLPYVLILLSVFVYQYFVGIALSLWLLLCQAKGNAVVRDAVGRRTPYAPAELTGNLLYIAVTAMAVLWLTSGQQLYRLFTLAAPHNPLTVWQALFLVLVADSLLRFSSMVPKLLLVAALKPWVLSNPKASRRQARLLTFVEYLVSGYRALVPAPVWYRYFVGATVTGALSSLLAWAYLCTKLYHLARKGRLLVAAGQQLLRAGALYGSYVDHSELDDAAMCCPVCQDPAENPVRLECSHVFCEECISEWLERHQTCPMCRRTVKAPGLESYGDGSTPLLPQLF